MQGVGLVPALWALEGLDGTGKTRLGGLVAEALGATYRHTPAPDFDLLRARLHPRGGSAALLLYLCACADAWESQGPHARSVIDRFWFSSLVQHTWRQRANLRELRELIDWTLCALPVPACTVLLWSDGAVRQARLQGRPEPDAYAGQDAGFEEWWRAAALLLREHPRVPTCWVDTSDSDEGAAVQRILAALPREDAA